MAARRSDSSRAARCREAREPTAPSDDGELLFTWLGRPLARQRFGHLWRPAAKAAELTTATGSGMHALRHGYASLLIRYGESVKTVQARLGHKSVTETLDTYGHMWADSDDRTREAVDSVLGAPADCNR